VKHSFYNCAQALQTAIAEALAAVGLDLEPDDVLAAPRAAPSLGEQLARVARRSHVLALVRRVVPVSEDDRGLIYRLVDAATDDEPDQDDHLEAVGSRREGGAVVNVDRLTRRSRLHLARVQADVRAADRLGDRQRQIVLRGAARQLTQGGFHDLARDIRRQAREVHR